MGELGLFNCWGITPWCVGQETPDDIPLYDDIHGRRQLPLPLARLQVRSKLVLRQFRVLLK